MSKKDTFRVKTILYPDPPILAFPDFLAFFVFSVSLAFFVRFAFLFQGFEGFSEGKNPCFFPGFPLLFSKIGHFFKGGDLNPGERHSRDTRDDGTVTLCTLRTATVLSRDCRADFGRPLTKKVMSHSRDGPGVTAPSRTNIVPLTGVWNPPPFRYPPLKSPRQKSKGWRVKVSNSRNSGAFSEQLSELHSQPTRSDSRNWLDSRVPKV